jgi:hypothetical protein
MIKGLVPGAPIGIVVKRHRDLVVVDMRPGCDAA